MTQPNEAPPQEKLMVDGREAIVVPRDSGLALTCGPIIVYLIRDANDERFYLSKDGKWITEPKMWDAHNPKEAAEQFIRSLSPPEPAEPPEQFSAHTDKVLTNGQLATIFDAASEAAANLLRPTPDALESAPVGEVNTSRKLLQILRRAGKVLWRYVHTPNAVPMLEFSEIEAEIRDVLANVVATTELPGAAATEVAAPATLEYPFRESGDVERILCSRCGSKVSSPVPKGTVCRAWVECPECIERAQPPDSAICAAMKAVPTTELNTLTDNCITLEAEHNETRRDLELAEKAQKDTNDQLTAALAELKTAREEIELAKRINSEYRLLKHAANVDSSVINVAIDADNKRIEAEAKVKQHEATILQMSGATKVAVDKLVAAEDTITELTATVERLQGELAKYARFDEAISRAFAAYDAIREHFNEDGTIKGDGKWRLTELNKHAKELFEQLHKCIGCDAKPLADELVALTAERDRLKRRLLSAAGDDLCRLSQEEIKQYTSGEVQIPPKEEFIASCERFHEQIAAGPGVLTNCLTLAQLIAENQRLTACLQTILGWDCLHPEPATNICGDFPWLKKLVQDALSSAGIAATV